MVIVTGVNDDCKNGDDDDDDDDYYYYYHYCYDYFILQITIHLVNAIPLG